ncbi:heat shock protein 70 family [Zopfochytrium polystomum]|nr:heat shock protein 70 family [Zopfochytrium polystomum]
MSVVGIDFGNLNTVVAVARNRGIDVITNEVSNRATPSLVSFGDKQRYMGESAKTQEISNFKSTVSTLKRLIGRPFSDPEILAIEQKFVNAKLVEGERGEVAAQVQFQGETRVFTFTQLTAMFLGKVKDFTQKEIKIPMSDCVISCPGWYTDRQRRALRDAAEIAGLNCLRVMNDLTAAALGYGITKLDLPDPAADPKVKPRNVLFVDLGHASYQVAIASFVKGKLIVKASAYDRNLGGRDFDEVLVDHYITEFDAKYKMKIRSNPKAVFRLRQACEKVKKILSANSVTMLNVESLLDDKDVSAQVQKSEYSEWVKPLFDRLVAPVKRALEAAQIDASEIDFVELVGGSTRIPAVKEFLNEYFKGPNGEHKLSTTLNQDEAVARGCALQCAIVSPVFKVRDFAVQDWNAYPIQLHWDPAVVPRTKSGEVPETIIEVFGTGNAIPSAKALTFYRSLTESELAANNGVVSFDIEAIYAQGPEDMPKVENGSLGKFSVKGVRKLSGDPNAAGDGIAKATIKLKARLDGSNFITLDSAQQIEEVLVADEEKKEEKKEDAKDEKKADAMETDEASSSVAAAAGTGAPPPAKLKRVTRKHDLTVVSHTGGLSTELLGEWHAAELSMEVADRLVVDTAEKRNQLEEYVYYARGQLEMAWSEFITDADRATFNKELDAMEDWLYGEGEDAAKGVYVEKLDELKKKGDPVAARYKDSDERPRAEKLFREFCNGVMVKLAAEDDRYAHIPAADLEKVSAEVTAKLNWLNEAIATINETPKHISPKVTVAQINKEREQLANVVNPILNRPKPAPAPPSPKKEDTPAPESGTQTPATEETLAEGAPAGEEPEKKEAEMEVD